MPTTLRRSVISAATLLGVLGAGFALPAAASAETQQFTGWGSSYSLAVISVHSMSRSAGFDDSQCHQTDVTAWDWDDWNVSLECTR